MEVGAPPLQPLFHERRAYAEGPGVRPAARRGARISLPGIVRARPFRPRRDEYETGDRSMGRNVMSMRMVACAATLVAALAVSVPALGSSRTTAPGQHAFVGVTITDKS